ncbi:MAG TPA: vitamin B12-dependent ribonucleotide reductase [Nitrososphaerales archaeon]|nr:vitamin B12-dependent ribonucleotide reductase [Nitrososphaerales archaeon]
MISRIKKRDGSIQAFNKDRITNALTKAFRSLNQYSESTVESLTDQVVSDLNAKYLRGTPSVEDIQDIVENCLIKNGFGRAAKAYILYRNEHAHIRDSKKLVGVVDDLKLELNAIKVLERRYLKKDENGNVVETPNQLFRRVARSIAKVDKRYDSSADVQETEQLFYNMMTKQEFLPNSPTLMNAGTRLGQLSACFVIPIDDNLSSIFDAVKATALIHQSGGGTGYSFSRVRPRGDYVKTSGGVASGPVSFMKIFDATTEEIKQGGRRRGANMGILSVYHPDIMEFITAKSKPGFLQNFNVSVAVDDKFMKAALTGKKIDLVNPRNTKAVANVSASEIFEMIVSNAWETGDPGLVFIDTINRANPTPGVGPIEATNPCGEQPLLPYESCNLGSINLTRFVKNEELDWEKLRKVVRDSIHFLDNVIDANRYPLNRVARITLANRKIGLGVMGFAEMLIMLSVRYDSEEALLIAHKLMKFIQENSHKASQKLAESRGSFPNFKKSIWYGLGYKTMRNATTTTIAPTGTISIIAGCSSGIEPLFAVSFVRDVMDGTKLLEVNKIFEELAIKKGFFSSDLLFKIAETGSVQGSEVPSSVKNVFRTALDISPEWHVRIQAAFQKNIDNAVSKTINLPQDASLEDVRHSYLLAWRLRCKGITVYRYGSKSQQVLTIGSLEKQHGNKHVVADSEYSGGCVGSTCPY